jgi:hypothetical protein
VEEVVWALLGFVILVCVFGSGIAGVLRYVRVIQKVNQQM